MPVFPDWCWRYSIPVVTVAIATALRFLLSPVLHDEAPFLLQFPGVLLSGAFGGFGPGALATGLGTICGSVLLTHPTARYDLFGPPEILRVALFLVEGLLVSMLGASLQSARRRAEYSEAQTRRLERQILDISDAEQRRIGQDLHDGLGQELTGVAFLAKALQQKLQTRHLPEAEDANHIAALVNESIGHTRAMAKGLTPVALNDGLEIALSQLAITTSSVFGIECYCQCEEDLPRPDRAVANHLFRIAQEAVNNAVKHAQPSQIRLSLAPAEAGLSLQIEDNGVGFDHRQPSAGMGLHIMDFRARIIGGSLQIGRAGPGLGTRVVCVAPLQITSTEAGK